MSDDEGDWRGRDESEEEEEEEPPKVEEKPVFKPKPAAPPPQPAQKTEAQLAMERRRNEALNAATDLDDHAKDMLRKNQDMRSAMDDEISEMRAKSERRKAERQAEEARIQQQRAEEDARRKAEEEDRRKKKDEEEAKRRDLRASKMAEFEKWKNPPKPNFIITKRDSGEELTGGTQGEEGEPKKSAEQLEAEKKAILAQRIQPLPNVAGMDMASLISKASELHNAIFKLESDKYDLEQRFKKGQVDLVELAERARQMSKGGKGKGIRADTETVDKMQERFGAPPKISLCSKYERRKDKRSYDERFDCFTGPQYLYPVDKVQPEKQLVWGDNGPEYAPGGAPRPAPAAAPEPEPEPVEQAAE